MTNQILSFNGLQYIVRYPRNFHSNGSYPVIFYLHGSGTRGKTPEQVMQTDAFQLTAAHKDFPFLFVAPLCPPATTWYDLLENLKMLISHIQKHTYCDNSRFYLMGASMGAYGVWQLAMSTPEIFAAILPICGGGMYWNAKRLVDVPVWAFHGGNDQVVLPDESQKMVDAVNKAGGCAKLTIYPENAHNAWSDTYANPEVFQWLLQHKNRNCSDLSDEYTDAEKFG